MKKMLRIFSSIIAVALMAAVFVTPASAATGYQGYAIYRDGVQAWDNGPVINWHTGIMYDPYTSTSSIPLIHHPGGGQYVQFGTWAQFMDGKTFMGVYAPKGGIISADRDKVRNMAYKLATDQIPYHFWGQMFVDESVFGTTQTRIEPRNITGMRCDGVVEYSYEYCNYKIYGGNNTWNISKNNRDCFNAHNNIVINPKVQAGNYMTLFISSKP